MERGGYRDVEMKIEMERGGCRDGNGRMYSWCEGKNG